MKSQLALLSILLSLSLHAAHAETNQPARAGAQRRGWSQHIAIPHPDFEDRYKSDGARDQSQQYAAR